MITGFVLQACRQEAGDTFDRSLVHLSAKSFLPQRMCKVGRVATSKTTGSPWCLGWCSIPSVMTSCYESVLWMSGICSVLILRESRLVKFDAPSAYILLLHVRDSESKLSKLPPSRVDHDLVVGSTNLTLVSGIYVTPLKRVPDLPLRAALAAEPAFYARETSSELLK